MMPGQFGPISRERRFCRNSQALTMSSVGMPSEMQTMRSSSASAASMMASAANGGGTKITVASAPVFSTASCTDSVTFLLDGGLNNDLLDNSNLLNPNPDAIAEFRLLTSNYTAEYGRNGGR